MMNIHKSNLFWGEEQDTRNRCIRFLPRSHVACANSPREIWTKIWPLENDDKPWELWAKPMSQNGMEGKNLGLKTCLLLKHLQPISWDPAKFGTQHQTMRLCHRHFWREWDKIYETIWNSIRIGGCISTFTLSCLKNGWGISKRGVRIIPTEPGLYDRSSQPSLIISHRFSTIVRS